MSDHEALIGKLRQVATCIHIATDACVANDVSDTCLAAAAALDERAPDFHHLASAMRKMLPPALLADVIAHLDPLTPFVAFLRRTDGT